MSFAEALEKRLKEIDHEEHVEETAKAILRDFRDCMAEQSYYYFDTAENAKACFWKLIDSDDGIGVDCKGHLLILWSVNWRDRVMTVN